MAWYGMMPSIYILWVPLIIAYTILAALAFVGAAINVYYGDVGTALPVLLSLLLPINLFTYAGYSDFVAA